MEKRMIYVVCENDVPFGNSYQMSVEWDLNKAKSVAENCLAHLTKREKAKTAVVIEGYMIDVVGNAKESWNNVLDNDIWLSDPEYYEVVEEVI